MDELDEVSSILLWVLVATFAVAFLGALIVMISVLLQRTQWTLATVILILLPWPLLGRDIDMAYHHGPYYLTGSTSSQDPVAIILGGLPNYMFFTCYSLLVFFWVVLFHNSRDATRNVVAVIRWGCLALNLVVYTIWLTLIILLFTVQQHRRIIHDVESVFAASLNFVAATLFCIYGGLLFSRLKRLPVVISNKRMHIASKIGWLAIFCTVILMFRGAFILLDNYLFTAPIVNIVSKVLYQLFCELFPTIFIITILRTYVPKKRKGRSSEYEAIINDRRAPPSLSANRYSSLAYETENAEDFDDDFWYEDDEYDDPQDSGYGV
mmetsp:Transcript_31677/g.79454  ORF Transcript_31677/g.79454 Transcript_31677/m.79454 type:complete len:323 (-) Transcript_31677:27-995(-)|eukprot:CAMPEP_0174236050 /NCGR_PEP_ID=MMETSP0417-20130205/5304_1 /TAXON_ID=242541 /ORGANISM="Mayorella sp, Strain BSH-02190019" /LENGTH=322 /DNA_ID=CAMNT_0015314641 /DNA_START=288 /DNA_END=1256 /DNA_ORIENTATION=-